MADTALFHFILLIYSKRDTCIHRYKSAHFKETAIIPHPLIEPTITPLETYF